MASSMILVSQPYNETPSFLLGNRRSIASSASRAYDLPSDQRLSESAAAYRSGGKSSAPMSLSPPVPLKTTLEVSTRGEIPSLYAHPRPEDGYCISPGHLPLNIFRDSSSVPYQMSRSYPHEQQRLPYFRHHVEEPGRLSAYGLPPHHAHSQGATRQLHLSPPAPSPTETYSALGRPSAIENQPYTSPKPQRKTKGHVASACVPCKRAHLRCDAQRPCSRCLGNGKEDACIDVQHKKRGRPRLRDERDSRFDPTRYPHPQVALHRPLSIYPPRAPGLSGYEDPLQRQSSFRSLDSRPGDLAPLPHHDRSPASSTAYYTSPVLAAPHSLEPLVYLDMEFEIIKASPAFLDAIRKPNMTGRKFSDLVAPSQLSVILALQGQFASEQRFKEPNYLPPIIGRVDNVIQELGFGADDAARFQLVRQEYFSFIGTDNLTRTFPVRFGLAKQESHYFIVALLNFQSLPSPSQYARDRPVAYSHQSTPPHSAVSEHAPTLPSFDPRRERHSDGSIRLPPGLSSSSSSIESPGSTHVPMMSRSDYSGISTYQSLRGDLPQTSRPPSHAIQLPPIRAGSDPRPSRELGLQRDERSSRVDIGGLIDKPADSERRW